MKFLLCKTASFNLTSEETFLSKEYFQDIQVARKFKTPWFSDFLVFFFFLFSTDNNKECLLSEHVCLIQPAINDFSLLLGLTRTQTLFPKLPEFIETETIYSNFSRRTNFFYFKKNPLATKIFGLKKHLSLFLFNI